MMTVSRALRGKKGVSDELRRRINEVADELGYRVDSNVSQVMASLRRSARPDYRETIAFVRTHVRSADSAMIEGAAAQGERLGYKLEVFQPWEQGLTGRDMSRVLHARGIRGVLLGPNASTPHPRYWLDWPKFAVVLLGSSLVNRGLHRVQLDHYGATFMGLRKLKHAGYKRIGLVIDHNFHERTWHRQMAAFQAYVGLAGDERDRLMFFVESDADRPRFLKWIQKEKPDALLCDEEARYAWTLEITPSSLRPEVVVLNTYKASAPFSGIRQHEEAIGREGVNVLATQLSAGQLGLQPFPHILFVPGTWQAGTATREGSRRANAVAAPLKLSQPAPRPALANKRGRG